MRALSLTQPWATLIAIGAKRIETRSWRPGGYQAARARLGEPETIAIHAARAFPFGARTLCATEPFESRLNAAGYCVFPDDTLPIGAIVAVAEIADVCRTEQLVSRLSEDELAFGDYSPGRWGWLLANVRRVEPPVACRGALGLWRVPDDHAEAVRRAIS